MSKTPIMGSRLLNEGFAALAILNTWMLLGVPFTHPYRVMQAIVVSLMIVGLN